ncbi:MAG: hypothetical protein IKD69_13120 [Solobacterium sp.]|nr:hypothetical protein [Solobacterium sp.]
MQAQNKKELFETMPVAKALATMAVPTIISQIINLVYNMVDAFFIGRTGNSYMMAATTLTLTLTMMSVAFSNLFGVGGGSLIARLMGAGREQETRKVSSFSFWGTVAIGAVYALFIGLFLNPVLLFLGASEATLGFARQYTLLVIVAGAVPTILSLTLAHILRNTGNAGKASLGLSGGGILNMVLDPLFMFVLLPPGNEVIGAALATLLSNILACAYLLYAFHGTSLSWKVKDALSINSGSRRSIFVVGVPSAILTGLFDVANICVNMLAAGHNDLVLAGMGIVMKVERVPNAVNVGLCQGMLPIVAYNYASGNRERMRRTVSTARLWGLTVSFVSILLFELCATPLTGIFLSTKAQDTALVTLSYAALFLRIRCLASPLQFINYSSSFSMQAIDDGKRTMLHAVIRELVFYIPFMFILDRLFGETGLAFALVAGEGAGALTAVYLLKKAMAEKK